MKFRSEVFYGEGYRDAAKVMAHEIFELKNTDILDTLCSGIFTDSNLPIVKQMAALSQIIQDDAEKDDTELFYDRLEDPDGFENECMYFTESILDGIKKITGKDIKYALWLCDTPEDVRRYCIAQQTLSDEDIDIYEESNIILSDIGADGKLYGYENLPKIIEDVICFDFEIKGDKRPELIAITANLENGEQVDIEWNHMNCQYCSEGECDVTLTGIFANDDKHSLREALLCATEIVIGTSCSENVGNYGFSFNGNLLKNTIIEEAEFTDIKIL